VSDNETPSTPGAIAVIGMACRFPGADSPDALWQNLRTSTESITFFTEEELRTAGVTPAQMQAPGFVAAKGVLDRADCFDAAFFGLSPREAAFMDPQQRVFLECAWAALEDAGYGARGDGAGAIGVFAGSILSMYLLMNLWPNRELVSRAGTFQTAVGNDPTFLATSTSYHLDLRGPSVSVGTACSTSLVAVHLACQSLLAYESDMALAGGVSVHLPLVTGYRYEPGGILSPDGHCRPFDAGAQGTVSSDGAGVVVLKRLDQAIADGDFIHAVIRGSAINNDGREKVGYTAPSVAGQTRVITEALAMAGVEPDTISMIETHGAGTLLGDPIEVAALIEAFGDCDGKREFCALSSVKSNVGHLDAAAGVAGLIKTVLALRHREIPATLHFEKANPQLDFSSTPFRVNARPEPVPGRQLMRAGVSSFGIGGTNAHVLLEEAPKPEAAPEAAARPFELLVLSARTQDALEAATDRLAEHLDRADGFELADVAYTLRRGRRAFEHRRILVCQSREDAISALRARDGKRLTTAVAPTARPSVVFMFPGLGDHYAGMGWELYCTESEFRDTVDRCAALLRGHLDEDIRNYLYPGRDWSRPVLSAPEEARVASDTGLDLRAIMARARKQEPAQGADAEDRPAVAQPAIFVTEVALAALLRSWGIEPEAMVGYSIGELAAAHISGVLSLPDALELVATRARLIQSRVRPGAMLAVPLSEQELRALLPAGLSLGAVNGDKLCVASGDAQAVAELEARLREREVSCQQLRSTHAYHSQMMEGIIEPLTAVLRRLKLSAPQIPYVSCVTGRFITEREATDPAYWAQHLCRTVRFQDALSRLFDDPGRVLLEVGPGQTLAAHAIRERSMVSERTNPVIPTMRRSYAKQSELAVLVRGIGELWLAGATLDTSRCLAREGQRRVPLPTYPFERQRHWIDPPAPSQGARSQETDTLSAPRKKADVADWFYLPAWKPSGESPARVQPDGTASGHWLVLVDEGAVGTELAERLRTQGARVVIVRPGSEFGRTGDGEYTVDPGCSEDYEALMSDLRERGQSPETIVHLWSLTRGSRTRRELVGPSAARFESVQTTGYDSVVRLFRAISRAGIAESVRLQIVANHLYDVTGSEELVPEKATLCGPVMVAPQEHRGLACRVIDTDIAPDDQRQREALLAQLIDEICSDATEPAVAYRRGLRWVQTYEPVRLPAVDPARSPFRQRGVYLLTGGLGGIGLILARHLAETVQARLVLIGRSAFPAQTEWSSWLATHDESDPSSQKIRSLQALEALGAEVLVLSADVADPDAMRRVLAAVDERFGALHGVIHGAGVVGIETFCEMNQTPPSDTEAQFVAKVRGLLVLEQILADRPLDFCLLMSSLSAILGGLGFAAYSAANLFMDAFARWKNRTSSTPWTSIDWDSWRLADVRPKITGLGATVSEFVMEPEEGAAACERVLARGSLGQIVVSSGDLHARLRQWIHRDGQPERAAAQVTSHDRPSLSTPYEAPRGELERQLAEIWQELFGIAPIGVHDSFFELGGHSLLATQLNARLYATLQVEMSLAALLQAPTIAELAVIVVDKQAETADPELLEQLLAELGDISGPELQRLLAEEGATRATMSDD
jgi:acyl transferase domain-containing protein